MKIVNIYVQGIAKSNLPTKDGKYVTVLEYKGKTKILYGEANNTTSNRMLITGVIEGVKLLKEPCEITIYVPTNLGLKSTKPNKDLINILKELFLLGRHTYIEVVSNNYKAQLNILLRTYMND